MNTFNTSLPINSWHSFGVGMWTSILPRICVLLLNRAGFLYGSVWLFWFWLKEQAKGTWEKCWYCCSHMHSLSGIWRWGPVVSACPTGSFPRQHRSCDMKMCHTGSIFIWTLCSHFPRSISRKSSGMSCNVFLWWLFVWLSPEWGCWHRPFLQGLTRARHTAAADMPAAQE